MDFLPGSPGKLVACGRGLPGASRPKIELVSALVGLLFFSNTEVTQGSITSVHVVQYSLLT